MRLPGRLQIAILSRPRILGDLEVPVTDRVAKVVLLRRYHTGLTAAGGVSVKHGAPVYASTDGWRQKHDDRYYSTPIKKSQ